MTSKAYRRLVDYALLVLLYAAVGLTVAVVMLSIVALVGRIA